MPDPARPRTVVVTGSASGIGAATRRRLESRGDLVIGVDLHDADVVADLSTPWGRTAAIDEVVERADGNLDGAVCAAGLGPARGRELLIAAVNFSGVVELLDGWRTALASEGGAKVVVIGSNSTTTTPFIPRRAVSAFLDRDVTRAVSILARPGRLAGPRVYAASKLAVTRWARASAVESAWVGAGIRLNVLAPGAVATPLLAEQLAGPDAANVRRFPVPAGAPAEPDLLAQWVEFMLSPAADFLVGSCLFVDGGSDAYLRGSAWPAPVPMRSLPAYLRRMFSPAVR